MALDTGNSSTEDLNNQQLLKRQNDGKRIRAETESANSKHAELTKIAPSDSIEERFEELRSDTKDALKILKIHTKSSISDLKMIVGKKETEEEKAFSDPFFPMKKIKNYTSTEAKVAFKRSQQDYKVENSWGRAANTNMISEIQSNSDRDAFQERLIKKMFGGKMYSSEQLAVYDNRIGYKLVGIPDFETELTSKNIEDVETETLQRYVFMLEDVYDGRAEDAIKRIIDVSQLPKTGKNTNIIRGALQYGGWRARKIEEVNAKFTVEEVKKKLKKGKNSISDSFLRRYIESEINNLRGLQESETNWNGKNWSLLLLSLVMKQTSKVAKLNKGAHNDAQDNIITKIQSEHPGEFIQGYNSETSNYLIKIEDFEKYLRNPSTVITSGEFSKNKSNPNVVNSRAFANYIKHLNASGDISIDLLQKKIGTNRLKSLQGLWKPGNGKDLTLAQKLLNKTGLGKVFNMIENFDPEEIIGSTLVGGEEYNVSMNAIMLMDKRQHREIIKFIEKDIQSPDGSLREYFSKIVDDDKALEEIIGRIEGIMSESGNDINLMMRKLHGLKTTESLEEMDIKKVAIHIKIQEHQQIRSEIEKMEQNKTDGIDLTPQQEATLESLNRQEIVVSKQRFIINHLNEQDVTDIVNSETTVEEIVERLRIEDEDFDKKISIYEEIEQTQEQEVLELAESEVIDNSIHQAFEVEEEVGTYTITTPEGEIVEGLTSMEFQEVSESEEALDNLVDMKNTLEECNLDYCWKNRHTFFTAIGNMNTLGFNIQDGNYVNPAELKFILTMMVLSVEDELGEKNKTKVASLKSTGSLAEAINLVKDINGEAGILSTEDANGFGDSIITKLFVEKFVPRESSQVFDHGKFQESLVG